LKILVLGESGVGKTSLMCRFVDNKFSMLTKSTIGSDFLTKSMEVDGKPLSLQIWDTAGQERYQSLANSFYRGADGVVFVFDCTRASTFDCLRQWIDAFIIQAGVENKKDNFPMIILGNKVDDEQNRKVSSKRAEDWCKENGNIPYMETSAKEDKNVAKAFDRVTKKILQGLQEENIKYDGIHLDKDEPKKDCGC